MEHDPDWYEEKISRFLLEEFHPGDKDLYELRESMGSKLDELFVVLIFLKDFELERIGKTPDRKH